MTRYGPNTRSVQTFISRLTGLTAADWSRVAQASHDATWRRGAEELSTRLNEYGIQRESRIAFDDAAFATYVANLGETTMTPAEVVSWTMAPTLPLAEDGEGQYFGEMLGKELANAAGFASNGLVTAGLLSEGALDALYRPFAQALPIAEVLRGKPLWSVVPGYVEARLRQPVPSDLMVIRGSTPVVGFGNVVGAEVASVGLNPSRQEFLSPEGEMLANERRRFETLASLGVPSLVDSDPAVIEKAYIGCRDYFLPGHNPYRPWFDRLSPVLRAAGASYLDGSACHLDLVQWATNPTWRSLPDEVRRDLLQQDVPFLVEELERHRIRLVLVNGAGALGPLINVLGATVKRLRRLTGPPTADLVAGEVCGVRLIGWSVNLQSSFGVTKALRAELVAAVQDVVGLPL